MSPTIRTEVLEGRNEDLVTLAAVNLRVRFEVRRDCAFDDGSGLDENAFVRVDVLTYEVAHSGEVLVVENDVHAVEHGDGTLDNL